MAELIMLVGLPGAGKSTYAQGLKEKGYIIHSSDAIREELTGNINEQAHNEEVFYILHSRVKEDLKKGKGVVYDATSLNRKKRKAFLDELRSIQCKKTCVIVMTPYEVCLAQNYARTRQVPDGVIVNMYKSFNTPWYSEGWDEIKIEWYDYKRVPGFDFNFEEDIKKWTSLSHDNPHHKLSIGQHMTMAFSHAFKLYCCRHITDKRVIVAAYMHDCGKPGVKSFIDSKGEPCDIAHYYQHENVGAYLCFFYIKQMYPELKDDDILYISLLINLHMRPHTAWEQSENAKEKDLQLYGEKVIHDVEMVYQADMFSH